MLNVSLFNEGMVSASERGKFFIYSYNDDEEEYEHKMVWNLYNGHKITQKLKNKVKSGEIPLIRGFEVFDETD